jgi:effector-binding domain-containing protein
VDAVPQGRRKGAPHQARGVASTPGSGSGNRIRERSLTDEPCVVERAAQPYLKITCQVTAGVPAAVDTAFPALFGWLGSRGLAPSGPPFIRTTEIDRGGQPLELEVGVPVAEAVSGEGEVESDTLPAGRYLTLLHVGPYRSRTEPDLEDARAALLRFAEERGIVCGRPTDRGEALECSVEHLRVGPVDTPDHSKWETEFAYLIVDG